MDKETFGLICGGLPGTCVMLATILRDYSNTDKLTTFLKNIIINKVFGSKLYYVWKVVCHKNDEELVNHDFTLYDDAYFIDKPI
jgi:hypothetical protein